MLFVREVTEQLQSAVPPQCGACAAVVLPLQPKAHSKRRRHEEKRRRSQQQKEQAGHPQKQFGGGVPGEERAGFERERGPAGAEGAGEERGRVDSGGNEGHGVGLRVGGGAGGVPGAPAADGPGPHVRDPGPALPQRCSYAARSRGPLLEGRNSLSHSLRPLPERAPGRSPRPPAEVTRPELVGNRVVEAPQGARQFRSLSLPPSLFQFLSMKLRKNKSVSA